MKMIKMAMSALVPVGAVIVMSACSGGGGSGGAALSSGTFQKSVVATIASGNMFPFSSSYTDQKIQNLYLASDIHGSGNIEKLTFTHGANEAADITCSQMTIKIGHTSKSALDATFALNVEEGKGSLHTVEENATITIPAGNAGETFDIVLSTPFEYNGVDNLILDFERHANCSASAELRTDTSGSKVAQRVYVNSNALSGTVDSNLNDIVFSFTGGVNTQIVAGAASSNSFPFTTGLRRTQHLYTSADVNGSGPITGIAFQMSGSSLAAEYNATVKLGHTALTEFGITNTFAENYASTPTTVAENVTFTIPAGLVDGDWFWVPLNGSFNYNGSDNLIADIEVTAASATNSVQFVSTGANVRAYGNAAATTPYGADAFAYNMKFRFNGATMDVITAGDAGSYYNLPFNGSSGYTTQFLYSTHTLGTGGRVTAVAFRLQNDATVSDYPIATIALGQTDNTTMTSDMAANMGTHSNVFSGTLKIPAGLKAGDWVTFPVSGFTYDPTKNLVVEVSQDAGNATNVVRGTLTDMPGASGWAGAIKGEATAFNGGSGHVDMRIMITK